MNPAKLTEVERGELRLLWELLEDWRDEIDAEVDALAKEIPSFAALLASMPKEERARQRASSLALQRAALVDGDWDGYLADLRVQGERYANLGIPFGDWFELVTGYRSALLRRLGAEGADAQRFLEVSGALGRFLDIALAAIGESYIAAKEETITRQQQAIRELSTPVLQLRSRLLLVPLVGIIDTARARHVTESVLNAARDRRAHIVVVDVTGVPIVDSKVANHLVQMVSAARLMGATVLVTGISAGIAQTLVTIGADLKGVQTFGELEDAIIEADRMLTRLRASSKPMGETAP